MNRFRLVLLVVVSVVIAILLATALGSFTRLSDSAVASVSAPPSGEGQGEVLNLPASPSKNYLPIIFLNSANAGGAWLLAGNAGTSWATDFLGTTDKMTLTLRVSNTVAYRLVPAAGASGFAPNLIGGPGTNRIDQGAFGATIAGGGANALPNVIMGPAAYGTIGGGVTNIVSGTYGVVGGGASNTVSGVYASIGGGYGNTVSGGDATIAGGYGNIARGSDATVGGGTGNQIPLAATFATIGGGYYNTASAVTSTISGGASNLASGDAGVIGGGTLNKIPVSGIYATIGGGYDNTASAVTSTISGGASNLASGDAGVIGGGTLNKIPVTGVYATIGGGYNNSANYGAATIGGGQYNIAGSGAATVGGGQNNTASGIASTVGGGINNTAGSSYATVAGGADNVAVGVASTVGGGNINTASGSSATVPGGVNNVASGNYSFAAGRGAHATHQGSFVWEDSNVGTVGYGSAANDEFRVYATGGVVLITGINLGTGIVTAGAYLPSGASAWSYFSDRNLKANLKPIDSRLVLAAVNSLPLSTWNYIAQDPGIRHIGPMAQDFNAAFKVGESDTMINTADALGVAFAAIQGLSQENQELEARSGKALGELREQNQALATRVASQEARLAALEAQSTSNAFTWMNLAPWGIVGLLAVMLVRRRT